MEPLDQVILYVGTAQWLMASVGEYAGLDHLKNNDLGPRIGQSMLISCSSVLFGLFLLALITYMSEGTNLFVLKSFIVLLLILHIIYMVLYFTSNTWFDEDTKWQYPPKPLQEYSRFSQFHTATGIIAGVLLLILMYKTYELYFV